MMVGKAQLGGTVDDEAVVLAAGERRHHDHRARIKRVPQLRLRHEHERLREPVRLGVRRQRPEQD
jgi:hypothetical protein